MNGDMYTLDNFYQSKVWVKFYTALRLERTDTDGNLICWYCGKPIVNKYDAIAHHTKFLTEQNVNDFAVSLNPELIQFVHHRCHNRIHNKFGFQKQEVFLVYGSPLAGKSTFVRDVSCIGDLVLDMDQIWKNITGGLQYKKPPCLNAVAFGMRDYLMDCIRIRKGKWQNAYIVGGYPLVSERERLCRQMGAREIYIDSSKAECLQRLELDPDRDKKEWAGYIETWWERYNPSPIG